MSNRAYRFPKTRNLGFRKPKTARPEAGKTKEAICLSSLNDSSVLTHDAVSQAVSRAVPLSNSREKLTTETNDTTHQSRSRVLQSAEPTKRPNCYQCAHRLAITGNAHSKCNAPALGGVVNQPIYAIGAMLGSRGLGDMQLDDVQEAFGVIGSPHGKRNGWFNWPINFDPAWLESCELFEEKQ